MRYYLCLSLLCLFLSMHAQSTTEQVKYINRSEFEKNVYPQMKRPLVILFGSNYCGYSKKQLGLLKQKSRVYYKKMDFYAVNADLDENYHWLKEFYEQEKLEALGTPTWIFYYGTRGDDDDIFDAVAGNFESDELDYEIEELIDWFERAGGYDQ